MQGHLREAEPGFCSGAASAAALLTAGHLQAQGGQRGLTKPAGTLVLTGGTIPRK